MSSINGDKARFHQDRKEKIARRKRNRERLSELKQPPNSAGASSTVKSKVVIS